MFRPLLSLFVCAVFVAAPTFADVPIPTAPTVDARAYIVIDYRTGKVLASQEAVARLEPASLTKLMTAYIVFQELAAGKLKLDEPVVVSEHAWRSEGSRTFIELGKPVSVELLILGMIVQSGNDATIALAERVGGTRTPSASAWSARISRIAQGYRRRSTTLRHATCRCSPSP